MNNQINNRKAAGLQKILPLILSEDEVKEYNFLVHWLQMTDIVVPSRLLTYNVIKMFRSVYLTEGYHKLTSYF